MPVEINGSASLPAYQSELPISVDTTGGDNGIDVQVEGALAAFREFGVRSILVGPEESLRAKLKGLGGLNTPIEIVHAPETISMDDSPTKAVRRKPNSSLCVAYNLVNTGRAAAVISAGNSGAMMAAGRLISGLLPGIERPAIATLIPAPGGKPPNVILDSGANVDCHARNLVQFAVMGSIYFNSLFNIDRPKVALLSNGSEQSKGTDVIRAASMALAQIDTINYVGYVEGRDIATDKANVIVCDGFVGNVVLKAMEGCVRLVFEEIVHQSKKGLVRKLGLGLSKGMYREIFAERFDYTTHGGAPLLGLRKLALVLHGSSDARAVKNAVRVADTFSRIRMTEKITLELTHLEDTLVNGDQAFFSGVLNTIQKGKNFKSDAPSIESPADSSGDE